MARVGLWLVISILRSRVVGDIEIELLLAVVCVPLAFMFACAQACFAYMNMYVCMRVCLFMNVCVHVYICSCICVLCMRACVCATPSPACFGS